MLVWRNCMKYVLFDPGPYDDDGDDKDDDKENIS